MRLLPRAASLDGVAAQQVPQLVLLLQQLHDVGKSGAAALDDEAPRAGQVNHGAAGAACRQLAAVKDQGAGGPQVLPAREGEVQAESERDLAAASSLEALNGVQLRCQDALSPSIPSHNQLTRNSCTATLDWPPLTLALVSASAERCWRATARMKRASGTRMPMAATPGFSSAASGASGRRVSSRV